MESVLGLYVSITQGQAGSLFITVSCTRIEKAITLSDACFDALTLIL